MGINNRKRRAAKKRKKVKKKKSVNKKDFEKTLDTQFTQLQNPFENLSLDDRKKAIGILQENAKDTYTKSLETILSILSEYEPLTLISMLSSYGLMAMVGDEKIERKDKNGGLQQADVEIAQALLLYIRNFKEVKPPTPEIYEQFQDVLISLREAFFFLNKSPDFLDKDVKEMTIIQIQDEIRAHTQAVRNWGHYSQVKRISSELYQPLDDVLYEKYGFNSSLLINFFDLLLVEIEKRSNKRLQFLKRLASLANIEEIVDTYCQEIKLDEEANDFKTYILNQNLNQKEVILRLLPHYDLYLSDNYLFDIDFVSKTLQVDSKTIKAIISAFSYRFIELSEKNIDYFQLDNPIWMKPIIELDDNLFFCALPQLFFAFILQIMDGLISQVNKAALSKRRSVYLEDKIEEIVKTRFPDSSIIKNLKWEENGIEYETDLITFIDSSIIIFEAKSGKIDSSSLRGAPKKLERDIKNLLIEPNIQSKRLKTKLLDLIGNPNKEDSLRGKLPVDLKNIHKVLRISVTLEYFSALQSNVKKLEKTDWIPKDFIYCPTMSIADFEKVFDVLRYPVEIIYYFEAREKHEATLQYVGDELDLLGYYIEHHLIFPETKKQSMFMLTDMSKDIDNYYDSIDAGLSLEKPKVKMNSLFESILQQLEKRKIHRWTEIGTILHSFPPEYQDLIASNLYKIKQNVRKNWMVKNHKNVLMYIPPANGEYALCYLVFNDKNKDKRHNFAENASIHVFENEHIKYCLVIGKNIDSKNPYDFIGIYEPTKSIK